jgi:protein-tyrosine phosphatase
MRKPDRDLFRALDIHTVIDFRSTREREQRPSRLPQSGDVQVISLPMLDPVRSTMAQEFRSRLVSRDFRDFDPSETITGMYRGLAIDCTDLLRSFVHTVLQAEGKPLLWHCTAGKDRAGLASAILLRLLGVPQETVIEDYMLSAEHADRKRVLMFLLRLVRGREGRDIIQPLLTVHREWIEAAFRSIDDRWGSFEEYSVKGLDLSPVDIAQLGRLYLQGT